MTDQSPLPVTLFDAMNDLEPLGDLLGPSGGHPGILDPSTPPRSVVFGPDFQMNIVAQSNLRWLDGVVLGGGKDYIALVVDVTGPGFEDVVEFDFTDPARFEVLGLVDSPTVDLRFAIAENDAFIDSCNGSDACQANLPGSPVGSSYVWSLDPWEIEENEIYDGLDLPDDEEDLSYRTVTIHPVWVITAILLLIAFALMVLR